MSLLFYHGNFSSQILFKSFLCCSHVIVINFGVIECQLICQVNWEHVRNEFFSLNLPVFTILDNIWYKLVTIFLEEVGLIIYGFLYLTQCYFQVAKCLHPLFLMHEFDKLSLIEGEQFRCDTHIDKERLLERGSDLFKSDYPYTNCLKVILETSFLFKFSSGFSKVSINLVDFLVWHIKGKTKNSFHFFQSGICEIKCWLKLGKLISKIKRLVRLWDLLSNFLLRSLILVLVIQVTKQSNNCCTS